MYEYYPFSPHNGITIADVHILLFSSVKDKFDLSWNYYYYYYYINCLILHFLQVVCLLSLSTFSC
jgi:hypothetical protein